MTGRSHDVAHVRALIEHEPATPVDRPAVAGQIQRLCRAAVRALPATGVGVTLIMDTGGQVTVAASNPLTEEIEEFQYSLGEGPCFDAYATRRPVMTSNLVATYRWPGYAGEVAARGIRAVFAFPLQAGAARVGAMDVYRDEVGTLSEEALAVALTFAEVATLTLLDARHGRSVLAEDAVDDHVEVFQAQGMVMVQLDVSLTEAIARLRAHAFASNRRLSDVARDVVRGNLELEPDEP